ncbi:GntR family transcriptional regulator [Novosphingobium rosa]|uniref:GntR family transcriptional regulator n=1 Tax=Novosphingobium rosa TaxID=76978 RepID=UPI0008295A63|nr:GntR family transcriptional regulator [Novosphingobium rosa]
MQDTQNPIGADQTTQRDVAQWLRDRIRRGLLVPGQRLVEADIIRDAGATRSRVREAFQRLEGEGLIVIEEFRGASVRTFTREDIQQSYRARMVLEGIAAHDFAMSGDQEAKTDLARLQDELNGCERSGNHLRFAELNDAWHATILKGSGNRYIAEAVARLRLPVHRLIITSFHRAERIDDANTDHRRITAAILEGRATEAERLMRRHINDAAQAATELDSDPSTSGF